MTTSSPLPSPGIGARSRGDAEVAEVSALFDELFSVCRSILGPGLRHSLAILRRVIPLDVEAVASGERVFDWVVPDEWVIGGATLTGPDGAAVADFGATNLARWNIHGGLSPWYRGAITHFWPSYMLEPQLTGMSATDWWTIAPPSIFAVSSCTAW
jgi:hypothetical protein